MIKISLNGATALFTTRSGGTSDAPFASLNVGHATADDPQSIAANLKIVVDGCLADEVQQLDQVHEANVHVSDSEIHEDLPRADAAVTDVARRALLATGADCPPVALSDGERVAIIHGGWRSLAAGVVERTCMFLNQGFGAVIGPGICRDHYEVGNEVIDALEEDGHSCSEGRQLDLRAVIERKLRRSGAGHVQSVDRCTYCEPEAFYSHRRDGEPTGRQAGIVWLN